MVDGDVSRRRLVLAGGVVAAAGLLPGCQQRAARLAAPSSVETEAGWVVGQQKLGVAVFLGIPYAANTAGENRFMPPKAPTPWRGVFQAYEHGPSAPQRPSGPRPLYRANPKPLQQGEDCLRLNVWTPATQGSGRPVMVWWHGGGFEAGSGSSVRYDGTNQCVRNDVVVVTVNHRLNAFGHCYLGGHLGPEFASSGNVGFLDLVAALRWVRDNIEGFGGDPDNVMIFGQSGGGRKVSLATAAPAAQGLFHRAVVQSGSHLRIQSTGQASELTDRLLRELNLARGNARRLQELPMQQVLTAQLKVSAEANLRFAPVMDGEVFDRHPWDPAAPAVSAHVPMIIGTTRTELSNQLGKDEAVFGMNDTEMKQRLTHYLDPEDISPVVAVFQAANPSADPTELFFLITSARGYIRDADLQSERRARQGAASVYRYCLAWHTPVQGGRRYSPHSLCVPMVFDNAIYGGIVGPPGNQAVAVAGAMSHAWAAFARSGDPNNERTPAWRPYTLPARETMVFDNQSQLLADPYKVERQALAGYPTQQLRSGRALHRSE